MIWGSALWGSPASGSTQHLHCPLGLHDTFSPSCEGLTMESQEDNQAPSICGKSSVSAEIPSFLLFHFSTQSVSGSWTLGELYIFFNNNILVVYTYQGLLTHTTCSAPVHYTCAYIVWCAFLLHSQ